MTIQQLLDGGNVKWIQVNIIEQLSETQYIVGDATGLAIMDTSSLANPGKQIQVGLGLKLIKPSKVEEDVIAGDNRFTPMKTKPLALSKPDKKRIAKLQNRPKTKPVAQQVDYVDFETIINDYEEHRIVAKTIVYVVTVSRLIDGKYGEYRICNIRDKSSIPLTLSLYSPHVGKLQDNQVYSLTKLKKTILKNDGLIRLSTTKFTKIEKGTPVEEAMFEGIQVADHVIDGCCIMFTNLSLYQACPKHLTKLDEERECLGCKAKVDQNDAIQDFHCLLQVEDKEDLTSVLMFRRHLNIKVDITEDNIEDHISQMFIGQNVRVHYNQPSGDTNIAVKVEILPENKNE